MQKASLTYLQFIWAVGVMITCELISNKITHSVYQSMSELCPNSTESFIEWALILVLAVYAGVLLVSDAKVLIFVRWGQSIISLYVGLNSSCRFAVTSVLSLSDGIDLAASE